MIKNRKYRPILYVNIKQYKDNEFVAVYADIYEAIEKTRIPYSSIYNNILCRIKTTHGFTFTGEKLIRKKKSDIMKNKEYKSIRLENVRQLAGLEKKERSCLMCGKKFMSRGIHNRRCQDCNYKVDNDKTYYMPLPTQCWADGKKLTNFKESCYPFQTSDL